MELSLPLEFRLGIGSGARVILTELKFLGKVLLPLSCEDGGGFEDGDCLRGGS